MYVLASHAHGGMFRENGATVLSHIFKLSFGIAWKPQGPEIKCWCGGVVYQCLFAYSLPMVLLLASRGLPTNPPQKALTLFF